MQKDQKEIALSRRMDRLNEDVDLLKVGDNISSIVSKPGANQTQDQARLSEAVRRQIGEIKQQAHKQQESDHVLLQLRKEIEKINDRHQARSGETSRTAQVGRRRN